MMEPRVLDAKESAKRNTFFRKVLFTTEKSQLVVMSLLPREEIGTEAHDGDQLLYAVKGEGVAVINDAREPFEKGAILCVPARAPHNVINTGEQPLKLFTIYAPPQHAPGTIHETKADAEAAEAHDHLPAGVA
jgi:mannose-6-phosphate isomerase-like protein (cupin superfamily)